MNEGAIPTRIAFLFLAWKMRLPFVLRSAILATCASRPDFLPMSVAMKTLAICLCAAGCVALVAAGLCLKPAFDGGKPHSPDAGATEEKFDPMNTVWVNRKKTTKITVIDGVMTEYFFYQGKFAPIGSSGKAERINESGEYVSSAGYSPLESYWNLKIADKLLTASVNVTDSPTIEITFAREGHEDDFPPLPVYAKEREKIAIRELESLSLAIGDLGRGSFEDGELKIPKSWKDLSNVYIKVEPGKDEDSLRYYYHEEYADNGSGSEKSSLKKKGRLTKEQADALFELATENDIMSHNPYRDSDGMSAPFLSNELKARFRSGEIIKIDSSHGFVYDVRAADRIVEFFRELTVRSEESPSSQND